MDSTENIRVSVEVPSSNIMTTQGADSISIELVYFDIHARGELTRLVFAAAEAAGNPNAAYKDTRLPLFMESKSATDEWTEVHAPQSPFGYVPYLNVKEDRNGQTNSFQVSGDGAVETFAGRYLNLLGKTLGDAAVCQTIALKAVGLLGPQLTRAGLFDDEAVIMQAVSPAGYIGTVFANLEKFVTNTRNGRATAPQTPYICSDVLSLADLAIYNSVDECLKGPRSQMSFSSVEEMCRSHYPTLLAIYDRISADLASYLVARQGRFLNGASQR